VRWCVESWAMRQARKPADHTGPYVEDQMKYPCLKSRCDFIGNMTVHARVSMRPMENREPVIVLVHGLLVSSRYMLPTAHRLATTYSVLIPDLPGWGRSSKPQRVLTVSELADALVAWFDAVGLERPVLVANSFGCQIVADLAARYPDRVALMVLLGPTVDPWARSLWKIVGRWLLDVPLEPPGLGLVILRDLVDMGLPRLGATIRRMLEDRIERKLPMVAAPTLVVRGALDTTVSRRWAALAARLLPDGDLVEIPRKAHTVNYNAPDDVMTIVQGFVEERGLWGADPAVHESVEPTAR
jgi:2-hydroxy-6-oxonona-2,4-dienedioate hydrolase